MGTLIIISQFILALAILVTLHELGHFLAARMFGIRVEKFYLFFDAFGFKLFKFKKGDTEYGIGWLPLGGYVKISGMIDESLDAKQMASTPEPWEFRSKPAWQRLIVMVGGVTVNLILGLGIIIAMLWINGTSYIPNDIVNQKGGIYASPAAREVGLMTGDQIIMLNGKKVNNLFAEFRDPDFVLNKTKAVTLKRNGKDTVLMLPVNLEEYMAKKSDYEFISPQYKFRVNLVVKGSAADKAGLKKGDRIITVNGDNTEVFYAFREKLMSLKDSTIAVHAISKDGAEKDLKIAVSSEGTIGFNFEYTGFENDEVNVKYSLGEAISEGTVQSFSVLGANIKALGKVVTGKVDAKKTLAGPIGIAQMFGDTWNWTRFWGLTAMLSLVLAFMNILPIPALDGGHVMFLLWEMVTGKPVNEKVLYIGQIIGMLMLAALIIFIFWVDISRALGF